MACQMGLLSCLKTDGGPAYIYDNFQKFCDKFGIIHNFPSAYNHQSNGQAERGIQELKKQIRRNDSNRSFKNYCYV